MAQDFKLASDNRLIVAGPEGDLEAVVAMPEVKPQAVAVVCHPHPQQQGTMHNKVVTTLVKVFSQANIAVIRFNFRGVGASAGEFGNIVGECADLRAVLDWVAKEFAGLPLYLAGFSFGSYIAAWGAGQVACRGLISIAPPVARMPFSELSEISCKWIVVQGDADEVVDSGAVELWAMNPPSKLKLVVIPGVGHFFHGKLIVLRDLLWSMRSDWGINV